VCPKLDKWARWIVERPHNRELNWAPGRPGICDRESLDWQAQWQNPPPKPARMVSLWVSVCVSDVQRIRRAPQPNRSRRLPSRGFVIGASALDGCEQPCSVPMMGLFRSPALPSA
jgi:hypothetical protein